MKTILITLFFLLFNQLHSQNSFQKIFKNSDDAYAARIIEDNNGDLVFVGSIINPLTNKWEGVILKINPQGEIIQSINISPENEQVGLRNIHQINNLYYVVGTSLSDALETTITLRVFNDNLELQSTFYYIIDKDGVGRQISMVDSDQNIVITGNMLTVDSGYVTDPFFFKLDLEGNLLDSVIYTTERPHDKSFGLIESADSTSYYAFTSSYSITALVSLLVLSKSFDTIDVYDSPVSGTQFFASERINDTSFLVETNSNSGLLQASIVTESFDIYSHNYFHLNEDSEHPAFIDGTSINNGNMFIAGTTNAIPSSWPEEESFYHLVKLDQYLIPIWQKGYSLGGYNHLSSIQATDDGGCVLVGTNYEFVTGDHKRSFYIVKVDADGIVTWEKEIPIPTQNALVFPNPGKEKLVLKTTLLETEFLLSDLQGKSILQQAIKEETTEINTQNLTSGTYLWTLKKDGKVVESGKWVKE